MNKLQKFKKIKVETKYFTNRKEWRIWLEKKFNNKDEIWLEYPKKETAKKRNSYNDAVEEALCFGWIDSTVKSLNDQTTIQRFSRRKKFTFSQANKERLKWLLKRGMIHNSIVEDIEKVVKETFIFPPDIIEQLKKNKAVWENYQQLSKPYQRIRIAYIEAARMRPEEFEKRLNHFINKTKNNQLIQGHGGIEKYY